MGCVVESFSMPDGGRKKKRKVESGKSNRGIEGLMGFSRAAT